MKRILLTSSQTRYLGVAVITFLIADQWRLIIRSLAPQFYGDVYSSLSAWNRIEIQSAVWIAIVLLGLYIVHRKGIGFLIGELGLRAPIVQASVFSFIATLPMLIGFFATSPVSTELTATSVLHLAVISPFAEEVLYRGYLFRQLYRRAAIGFIPAILVTAVLFGIGHFSGALAEGGIWNVVGVVAITGLGGAFFAWLFVRWKDNLWVPFGMHCLMNLWWNVFAVDDSALGGWLANIVRLLTVILAIFLTLYRDRIWREDPKAGKSE